MTQTATAPKPLEFVQPPPGLTAELNPSSIHETRWGLVPDAEGTSVLVALTRNRRATELPYMPVSFAFLKENIVTDPKVRTQLTRGNVKFRLPRDEDDFHQVLCGLKH